MSKEKDAEIVRQALEKNVGDIALGRRPNQQLSKKQRFALRANIEPGDMINRDHPTDNFQFAWCPFADTDFYHDLRDEGYKPVVEAEWIENRGTREWYQPDKTRWRWSETKMLVNRDEFLMYRNEDLYRQEQLNRLNLTDPNGAQDPAHRKEEAIESASRIAYNAGIEVDIIDGANGRPNKAGVRRTISI